MRARVRSSRPVWLLLSGALLFAAACSGPPEPPPPAEAASDVKVYTVRGKVTQLPDPERPGSSLMVHHEAIPDFENAEGEVVGMNAMIMPFPLGEGVSLEGVQPGDKVEITFEMRFKPKTYYEVTVLTPLPDDTELDLSGMVSGDA